MNTPRQQSSGPGDDAGRVCVPVRTDGLRPSAERRSCRIPHRLSPPDLGARSRAGDGCGRPLGRATRRSGDLGSAGRVSHGDGFRRNARPDGSAACREPNTESRFRQFFLVLPCCSKCGRRSASPRRWSASSPSSTGMRTEPNCRPDKARCSTAWASSLRPDACTRWASASARSIDGRGDRSCCASPEALVAAGGAFFMWKAIA